MLSTPISKAIRTTLAHVKRLEELGVKTVADFLQYYPRTYTDQSNVRPIAQIETCEIQVIRGRITSISTGATWRKHMAITTAIITDESGSIQAVWFNQAYLSRTLSKGQEVLCAGKIKVDSKKGNLVLQNPTVEVVREHQLHTARIVPVYHETDLRSSPKARGKISSKWIREKMFPLLPHADAFDEYIPEDIRKTYGLASRCEAIRSAHFPKSESTLLNAKRRLAFDELFLLQLAALKRRYDFRKSSEGRSKKIPPDWQLITKFTKNLPWYLTAAQKKAIYEIIRDMGSEWPMSRLLEGETGSGKTVVSAACALHAMRAGFQVCMMAPTEILARQHFVTLEKFLRPFSVEPTLITGSTPAAEKKSIHEGLKSGELQLVVGTHALVQESIWWKNLGLAIIDEQHRFGVRQREFLKKCGSPHLLHLTATPIPRTLALVLYGDQDLSILDEMPLGRKKVTTRIVPEEKRDSAYRWIEGEIKKGRQAFIVFPLINESEVLQVKAATQEFHRLQTSVFRSLKLALLHGQMASNEKAAIMEGFAIGKYDILVSTAVVEVGVDVPNATIMMIEGAERFGLAQLHQFRGRVGRGMAESFCLLFSSSYTPQTMSRLQALVRNHSGFKLAEIDLMTRGPGEVYGVSQSGIPDLKMALLSDNVTIKQAREAAESIMQRDPELSAHKNLRAKIAEQENIAIDY